MHWYSMLAIYVLIWFFSLFLVLPFGVRTSEEAGQKRLAGHADSAPHDFRIGRVVLRVTVVATVLFALFAVNYHYGWITPRTLDLFGGTEPVR